MFWERMPSVLWVKIMYTHIQREMHKTSKELWAFSYTTCSQEFCHLLKRRKSPYSKFVHENVWVARGRWAEQPLVGTTAHARGSWAPTHQQHTAFAHWSEHAGRKFKESLRNQLFLVHLPWGTLCMINYEFTDPVSLQDSSQEVRFKLMERS